MNLNVSCPINALSFGQVSYNILKQLYLKGLSPHWFPISADLASFDKCPDDMKMWLSSCSAKALRSYSRNNPEFRMWHISGSDTSHSKRQTLLTFHETSEITPVEKNILNNQENVLVTSNYTKEVMNAAGVNNVSVIHLGFDDENFSRIEKHPYNNQCIVWGIAGKFERTRKKTARLIKLWASIYGNNPKHRLHVHTYNGFLDNDPQRCTAINQQLINQEALEGKSFWNINIINKHLSTATEYNSFLNSIDIYLDGGGSEGWGIPQFTATALGKHLVTIYSNAVKEWATEDNAILVKPSGMIDCYDGMFFHPNQPFNQGQFFNWNDDDFVSGMKAAEERHAKNPLNVAGLELQKMSYSTTVDKILEVL